MTIVNPGPWVDHEKQEQEPWTTQDGIIKFLEFAAPIPEMSPRSFHLYWQKHHSPSAMNVVAFSQFMRKYNTGHKYPGDPLKLPDHYGSVGNIEGAGEVWLNRIGEVGDWLSNANYPDLIQPDEPRFIAQDGSAEFILVKEERLYEPEQDMTESLKTKVYLLYRTKAGLVYDEAHRLASGHVRLILDQPELKQKLRKCTLSHKLSEPLPLADFEMDDIDVVGEFWFDSLEAAAAFFAEPAYADIIIPNEQRVFREEEIRALTAKMRVVHDEFSFQPSTTQPMPFSW